MVVWTWLMVNWLDLCQAEYNFLTKLCFSCWALRWNNPLNTFPETWLRPDWYFPWDLIETPEKTSGLFSRPEEVIYLALNLISDQSSPSTILNPLIQGVLWFLSCICVTDMPSIVVFQIISFPILWVDQISNKSSFYTENTCSCISLGQWMQTDIGVPIKAVGCASK